MAKSRCEFVSPTNTTLGHFRSHLHICDDGLPFLGSFSNPVIQAKGTKMNALKFVLLASLLVTPKFAAAEETAKESANKAGNTVSHGAKKLKNRVKEATCTDSDLECKAKKAGHRVGEGADSAGNKIEETKDKAD